MTRAGDASGVEGQGRDAGETGASGSAPATVVPVVDEQLAVIGTREVETARVRVSKRVVETERVIETPLRRDEVLIERVRCDRVVDEALPIRTEGDVTIVPVYEEVMIKQLVLKEELHITRRSSVERRQSAPAVLRSERVEILRAPVAATEESSPLTK